jgi:hypothetical protein
MEFNPDATYDCLLIADRIQHGSGRFATAELHLFAYLACLLSLYRGGTPVDWGYSFVGTELGAPYSLAVDGAVNLLAERGCFLRVGDRFGTTESAGALLRGFSGLAMNRLREECLLAACSCMAAFSVGMVCSALTQEPDLLRASGTPMSRLLLEDAARTQLYSHFDALRGALRETDADLRLPAVTWLAALYGAREVSV